MEYLTIGERIGYKRGYAKRCLEVRYEILMRFVEYLFKQEGNELKQNIRYRAALIDQESELDNLINILFTYPTLASFMEHLPALEAEMTPS